MRRDDEWISIASRERGGMGEAMLSSWEGKLRGTRVCDVCGAERDEEALARYGGWTLGGSKVEAMKHYRCGIGSNGTFTNADFTMTN